MTAMLLAMFSALVLGAVTKDFGRRQMAMSGAIAVGLTALYYFHPTSMT
jgi:hypothetical protein